ncbi:MAG: helix-turn-helix transcriptional regulator [bacterium]
MMNKNNYQIPTIQTQESIRKNTLSLSQMMDDFSDSDQIDILEQVRYYELKLLLRDTRKKEGMTQQKLADLLNIPRTTIAKIESGQRNVTVLTLMKIAKVMEKKLIIELR